jgi:GNAT superfamily N-acetyltransferase
MASLAIRAATPTDIPTLHRLIRDFAVYEGIDYRFHLTETSLCEALFTPHPLIGSVVAETDDTIVGFALWLVFFGTMSGSYAMFVNNLFVVEKYRRHGIGSAIFRYLARVAVEKQYPVMQWDVNRLNTQAVEFYRHIGAQRVSNDLVMEELRGDALLALAQG